MLFPEKCFNFGEKYHICGKFLGIFRKICSFLGKTVVFPEKCFDPLNGTLTEIFLATGGGVGGGGGGELTQKNIFKCPFFSKSAPQSLAPPTFRSFLRP
jgi:hypothetical protein